MKWCSLSYSKDRIRARAPSSTEQEYEHEKPGNGASRIHKWPVGPIQMPVCRPFRPLFVDDTDPVVYTTGFGCIGPPGLLCATSKLTLQVAMRSPAIASVSFNTQPKAWLRKSLLATATYKTRFPLQQQGDSLPRGLGGFQCGVGYSRDYLRHMMVNRSWCTP